MNDRIPKKSHVILLKCPTYLILCNTIKTFLCLNFETVKTFHHHFDIFI
jgi:hypothetical protein